MTAPVSLTPPSHITGGDGAAPRAQHPAQLWAGRRPVGRRRVLGGGHLPAARRRALDLPAQVCRWAGRRWGSRDAMCHDCRAHHALLLHPPAPPPSAGMPTMSGSNPQLGSLRASIPSPTASPPLTSTLPSSGGGVGVGPGGLMRGHARPHLRRSSLPHPVPLAVMAQEPDQPRARPAGAPAAAQPQAAPGGQPAAVRRARGAVLPRRCGRPGCAGCPQGCHEQCPRPCDRGI